MLVLLARKLVLMKDHWPLLIEIEGHDKVLFAVYCRLYYFYQRTNPFDYFKHIIEAFTLAFACASSAATLHVTLEVSCALLFVAAMLQNLMCLRDITVCDQIWQSASWCLFFPWAPPSTWMARQDNLCLHCNYLLEWNHS